MKILSGEETVEFLDNVIHADTQVEEKGVDLTVNGIYRTVTQGEIDFGGGERKDGKIVEIEPSKRNPDDDYGWWTLKPGTYLIDYNERLKGEETALLQPLERLTRNQTTHPTKIVSKLGKTLLSVGGKGIAIKENSRVSRINLLSD